MQRDDFSGLPIFSPDTTIAQVRRGRRLRSEALWRWLGWADSSTRDYDPIIALGARPELEHDGVAAMPQAADDREASRQAA